MNKESKIFEFDPVIYPYKLWVIIDKDPSFITDNFLDYDGEEIQDIEKDTKTLEAFTMPVTDKKQSSYGVIIFFRSKKSITYGLAAHESSHAAKNLFAHIGADVAPHEPFEYVVGWVADCIDKARTNK